MERHHAPATPGDLLFHLRAERLDLCFEAPRRCSPTTWSRGEDEFGTYCIAYAHTPEVTEQMLENMFIGNPPGTYDRILDFSTAVTGNLFYVPPQDFLDDPPDPGTAAAADTEAADSGA